MKRSSQGFNRDYSCFTNPPTSAIKPSKQKDTNNDIPVTEYTLGKLLCKITFCIAVLWLHSILILNPIMQEHWQCEDSLSLNGYEWECFLPDCLGISSTFAVLFLSYRFLDARRKFKNNLNLTLIGCLLTAAIRLNLHRILGISQPIQSANTTVSDLK